MARRPQTWVISQHSDGTWSVWHGNRPVTTGLTEMLAAETTVRKARAGGEKVYQTDPAGYRIDRTAKFAGYEAKRQREVRGVAATRRIPRTVQVARERAQAARSVRARRLGRSDPQV